MVIKPPPPTPVSPLIRFNPTTSRATPHPAHPSMNDTVAAKKHARRPKMSENRPYSGWKAVLVMRYEVVSQDAVLDAWKSEDISA